MSRSHSLEPMQRGAATNLSSSLTGRRASYPLTEYGSWRGNQPDTQSTPLTSLALPRLYFTTSCPRCCHFMDRVQMDVNYRAFNLISCNKCGHRILGLGRSETHDSLASRLSLDLDSNRRPISASRSNRLCDCGGNVEPPLPLASRNAIARRRSSDTGRVLSLGPDPAMAVAALEHDLALPQATMPTASVSEGIATATRGQNQRFIAQNIIQPLKKLRRTMNRMRLSFRARRKDRRPPIAPEAQIANSYRQRSPTEHSTPPIDPRADTSQGQIVRVDSSNGRHSSRLIISNYPLSQQASSRTRELYYKRLMKTNQAARARLACCDCCNCCCDLVRHRTGAVRLQHRPEPCDRTQLQPIPSGTTAPEGLQSSTTQSSPSIPVDNMMFYLTGLGSGLEPPPTSRHDSVTGQVITQDLDIEEPSDEGLD